MLKHARPITAALVAALALAGCSTTSTAPPPGFVQAVEVPYPEPDSAEPPSGDQVTKRDHDDEEYYRDQDGDDYRAVSGMVAMSSKPGWKSQRQLEKEKIHRLAKECIRANNTSAPCLEIVRTDARMGRFYVLQESGSMSPFLNKWKGQ